MLSQLGKNSGQLAQLFALQLALASLIGCGVALGSDADEVASEQVRRIQIDGTQVAEQVKSRTCETLQLQVVEQVRSRIVGDAAAVEVAQQVRRCGEFEQQVLRQA